MKLKYDWLTAEILQKDYEELADFKKIGKKYNIPRTTIELYCKMFSIKTIPKISYSCNDMLFSTDTEESFYVAGFIAADGCICKNKCKEPNCIIIALGIKDEQHLLNIKNILQFTGPIKHLIKKLSKCNKKWNDSAQVRFDIYSKQMIKDLSRFNIGQRKSLIYDMPKWLINHPLVHHFLRGYNDGDGCFYYSIKNRNNKKQGKYISKKTIFSLRGTIDFLQNVKNIFENNGIFANNSPKLSSGFGQLCYQSQNNVVDICKFLYKDSTIYLDRKYDFAKELL